MTTGSAVGPEDFRDILAQAREFVREEVVPREQEIADTDGIPEDI
ncbi:MAG: acyl-CoA dehydrogenase family protein, partial [Mycobacteriaceae bacterium]